MNSTNTILTFEKLADKLKVLNSESDVILKAHAQNQWFTPKNQLQAIQYWVKNLKRDNLYSFISPYKIAEKSKSVGIIMAGNLPLVGFHDLLCVILMGHSAQIKMSSDDNVLMKWVVEQLLEINADLKSKIIISERLNQCDAVIATGSNNSSRYFNYYFKHIPSIIRKNRSGIAVLTGNETKEELTLLGHDIFSYFGLGCRNISKILVPEKYNFKSFFEAIEPFNTLSNHHKYNNNYVYHKALFLMNLEKHLDNGFVLLKEDSKLSSPLGSLFFSYYKERSDILEYLDINSDSLQVVIGHKSLLPEALPFGNSQNPELTDFADGINSLTFLGSL